MGFSVRYVSKPQEQYHVVLTDGKPSQYDGLKPDLEVNTRKSSWEGDLISLLDGMSDKGVRVRIHGSPQLADRVLANKKLVSAYQNHLQSHNVPAYSGESPVSTLRYLG